MTGHQCKQQICTVSVYQCVLPTADVVGGSHMVVNTLVAGGYDLVAEQVVCFDGHVHNV